MYHQIKAALSSIHFVNQLSVCKRGTIGDLVIELHSRSIDVNDALIIRNILLLLYQAGKLVDVRKPIHITDWFTIYHKDFAPVKEVKVEEPKVKKPTKEERKQRRHDDVVDALRYALCDVIEEPEEPKRETPISKRINIADVNLVLNNDKQIEEFMQFTRDEVVEEPKKEPKPMKIPEGFEDDCRIMTKQDLMIKYKKSESTIRRWMKYVSSK